MSAQPGADSGRYSRRHMLKIAAAVGGLGVMSSQILAEAIRQGRVHRVSQTRSGLGTLISITVLDSDVARAEATISDAFAEVARLEAVLSRHRTDTPVARLNREGRLLGPPPELLAVLREAEAVSRCSSGAFDVTMAPLLTLYEASYRKGRAPSSSEVDRARALVGYKALQLDGNSVSFARAGMALTLDGIAKGYVVDRVVDGVVTAGYERVLVDAGGDIGSAGALRSNWRVGVQDPRDSAVMLGVVRLTEGACIATSGDYMQAFNADRSAHPIIDPRTGYSPRLASAASVVAKSVLRADALSTAALVLGPEEGRTLLDSLPDVEGLVVDKDGTVYPTTGWSRLVRRA